MCRQTFIIWNAQVVKHSSYKLVDKRVSRILNTWPVPWILVARIIQGKNRWIPVEKIIQRKKRCRLPYFTLFVVKFVFPVVYVIYIVFIANVWENRRRIVIFCEIVYRNCEVNFFVFIWILLLTHTHVSFQHFIDCFLLNIFFWLK